MSRRHTVKVALAIAACCAVSLPAAQAETLDQAWQAALGADRPLLAGQLRVEAATEQLLAAKARRLPTLELQSLYTVRDSDQAFIASGPALPGLPNRLPYLQDEGFSYEATVRLPLYTHFATSYGISAAESSETAAALDTNRRELVLKMTVAEAYVAVLNADRVVEVADGNVRSLEAHVHDTLKRHENHMVPRNDVLAAEVQLSHARQRAIQARNTADKARAAYNRLLGRPLTNSVALDELAVPPITEPVDSLTARALATRPEIAQLSARAESLQFRSSATRARVGPRVELQGGHTFQENRFQDPEGISHASIALLWNALDGGRARHEAKALAAEAEAIRQQVQEFESVVALDVRRAWLDQQESLQRSQVANEALARSAENLRVAQERYRTGIGTNTEVLDAEVLRVNSYHSYYTAVYDAVLATLSLRYVVGEL